ncbi:MAG: M20/M25/M40 family metallo-hydrolase [Candidatus Rokubacteria bacterium]|nr:M20/M25/M40 family metallo-hydrolase [Candidatus Rokubacteria bacterium]
MTAARAAAAALAVSRRRREDATRFLQELVRVPSLTGEEGPGQLALARRVEALGLAVDLEEPRLERLFAAYPDVAQYPTHWRHDLILPYAELPTLDALRASGLEDVLTYRGRPNLTARWPGAGGGRSLILNGHMDAVTVEPRAEWTVDPFGAEVRDGFLYGRGSADMKAGLCAAVEALACLGEAGVRLRGDVVLQSVVNEEHAGNGTLDLVARGQRADAAIVLEPTENQVCVTTPGGLYWQLEVPGVPTSPGARWDGARQVGVSAIEKLPLAIETLLALERDYNRRVPHPLHAGRAPFSLVLGTVHGGHYETVTAGRAVLRGGAYFAPGLGRIGDVMAAMRQAVARMNAADPFLRARPATLAFLHHDDATEQPAGLGFAREVLAALGAPSGSAPHTAPFACDLRHLVNQGGMPGIVFGPGSIAEAHRPDERVPLGQYHAAIERLIAILVAWCGV